MKIDKNIRKETKYIAFFVIVLSVLMNAVFLILNKWDYTVLLGNLLSAFIAIMNFFVMGITIQKCLNKDAKEAKKLMQASQSLRNFIMFVIIGVAVLLPCFNIISSIVPVFFPRIAIMVRPLYDKKLGK